MHVLGSPVQASHETQFERVIGDPEFMTLKRQYHCVMSYGKFKNIRGHGTSSHRTWRHTTMKHRKTSFAKEDKERI